MAVESTRVLCGDDELIGSHGVLAPPERHLSEISDEQFPQLLVREQIAHRLSQKDLSALGGIVGPGGCNESRAEVESSKPKASLASSVAL